MKQVNILRSLFVVNSRNNPNWDNWIAFNWTGGLKLNNRGVKSELENPGRNFQIPSTRGWRSRNAHHPTSKLTILINSLSSSRWENSKISISSIVPCLEKDSRIFMRIEFAGAKGGVSVQQRQRWYISAVGWRCFEFMRRKNLRTRVEIWTDGRMDGWKMAFAIR